MTKSNLENLLVIFIIIASISLMTPSILEERLFGLLPIYWYVLRSLLLIILGGCVTYLCYRCIKRIKRFKIRTFPEIVDYIIGATMWKQLFALLCLSVIAFLFSWALMDMMELQDSNGTPLTEHQTLWMTICYFFDPGNLNLTPHDYPGIQGILSVVVVVLGMTILTGLFISTFTNVIDRRVAKVRAGEITYKNIRGHFVIIGFCELTESVIRGILDSHVEGKVVLLTNNNIENVRKSLFALLSHKEYDGRIILYSGDYRMNENLIRLNLPVSQCIYILGDDDMGSRDYENLATAQKISVICSESNEDWDEDRPVPVYTRMDRMPSFSTLQRLDIDKDFFSPKIYFRPFNYYEHWTRLLWTRRKVSIYDISGKQREIVYPSLFFDKTENGRRRYVHLVISGFSEMGMALTLQALRLAHYGNFHDDNELMTRITIVDPNIDQLKFGFESQFRNIYQIYDIKIDFMNCRLEDIDGELRRWSCDVEQMLTIAICLGDADTAISQALSLPLEVYYQHGRKSTELPNILVRQKSLSGIWRMLDNRPHEELDIYKNDPELFRKIKYNKYHNIYPFGMMVSGFYPSDMDDLKACLIHIDYEDRFIYEDKNNDEKITIENLYSKVIVDDKKSFIAMIEEALTRWHKLQENIKWANRYQTDIHNRQKAMLQECGITSPNDINADNEDIFFRCIDVEHRRWVAERVLSGWQQSPIEYNNKPMRQDSLLLHYDITDEIGAEKEKDEAVVKNILMLDAIFDYYKKN